MKAYVILTKKKYSQEMYYEDKCGNEIPVIKDSITAKPLNIVDKLLKKELKKSIRIYFTKKDAITNILEPSITDSILKSFNAAIADKKVVQSQLKSFFLIKVFNILLNTRKKVYACEIPKEYLNIMRTEDAAKYVRHVNKLTPVQISSIQLKTLSTIQIPGVKTLISKIIALPKTMTDSLSKEAAELLNSIKLNLKEIPLKKITFIDEIVELVSLQDEVAEYEQKNKSNSD